MEMGETEFGQGLPAAVDDVVLRERIDGLV